MQLLKQAVPRVAADAEPAHDLWPSILRQLDEHAATGSATRSSWVWFDVALVTGIAILGASFPATIPLLLYYL